MPRLSDNPRNMAKLLAVIFIYMPMAISFGISWFVLHSMNTSTILMMTFGGLGGIGLFVFARHSR